MIALTFLDTTWTCKYSRIMDNSRISWLCKDTNYFGFKWPIRDIPSKVFRNQGPPRDILSIPGHRGISWAFLDTKYSGIRNNTRVSQAFLYIGTILGYPKHSWILSVLGFWTILVYPQHSWILNTQGEVSILGISSYILSMENVGMSKDILG